MPPSPPVLSVLTQNLWGGAPGWGRRRVLLARAIARHAPDIVGLQEVHARSPADGALESDAHEIAALLGGYHAHYAPARHCLDGSSEGVALLCRGTVHERSVHALTMDPHDRFDRGNPRVVLCATIEVASRRVDVLATHLSLSQRARRRTVVELLAFAEAQQRRTRSDAAVLLGDFNAREGELALADLESAAAPGGPWRDVWKSAHGPGARGATWPMLLPLVRLDYVFIRPARLWTIEACDRLRCGGSDHLGVLSRLRLDAAARPSLPDLAAK